MNKENVIQKLENVDSMILIMQGDLTNSEGSCTENEISNTLNIMRSYIKGIASDIAIFAT